jgi:hypothetical protein
MLRFHIFVLSTLTLMGCQTDMPVEQAMPNAHTSAPMSNEQKVIAAIEANGCEMTISNMKTIIDQTGLSDSELAEVGSALESSGRADVSSIGRFRLTTGVCA